jgi:Spherulation-specific family 4
MPIAKAAAATLAALSVALAGGCNRDPEPPRQYIAVPAYWSPAVPSGSAMFGQLALTAPATKIVVVNGSLSAPEKPYHPAWASVVGTLSEAGIRPLGYVDTGYLGATFDAAASPHVTRPAGPGKGSSDRAAWLAQIEGDIEDWYALYGSAGLDGIFLDQTVSICGPDGAFSELYRRIVGMVRSGRPNAYVILNPGRSVEQCYADMADTIVTFEGTFDQYLNRAAAPAWEQTGAPERFWHLVHQVPDVAGMARAVELSKQRNAGYVYVTDDRVSADGRDHPWDTIPPTGYWHAELNAVFGPGLVLPSG